MTEAEYITMMNAISVCEDRERWYCDEYCRLNPQDRERRERDRELVLCGLMSARYQLEREFKDKV